MVGVDEVGRGAWAGPLLVVAARLKPQRDLPDGLTDSKMLSVKQKQYYYEQLQIVCDCSEGWVTVDEIDQLGLAAGLRLGASRAVAGLHDIEDEEIIIDGSVNFLAGVYEKSRAMIKADVSVPIVSAASVYAKVTRDKYMQKLHYEDPRYDFRDHVGYGTEAHINALKKYGVSEHHRKTFKPIMELL